MLKNAKAARETEPNVMVTASANTLVRIDEGKFSASNTDLAAAADSLKAFLAKGTSDGGPPAQVSQVSVLILGAGGVARSVAYVLSLGVLA